MIFSALRRVRPGLAAREFARAWAAYGAIEWALSVIVPWLTRPSYDYQRPHRGFSVLLLVVYPLVGYLLGATFDFLAARGGRGKPGELADIRAQKVRALGTLSVVSIFAGNVIAQAGLQIALSAVFFICGALVLGSTIGALSDRWTGRLSAVVSPWTASVLLLGVTWLTRDFLWASSRIVKVSVAGAYIVAIVSLALVVRTMMLPEGRATRSRRLLSVFRFPGYLPFLALLAVIAGGALTQQPKLTDAPAATVRPPQRPPDIFLIVMDTVRADHLSMYGYERDTAPHLNAFADHATIYSRAISASNMTLPSHASLFTGQYPSTHGAHFAPGLPLGRGLSPAADTIAEVLARTGYQTKAFAANYAFLGPAFQLDQGFEYYDQRAPVRFVNSAKLHFPLYLMKGVGDLLLRAVPSLDLECPFFTAAEINQAAYSQLAPRTLNDSPQFVFLNYMDAHWPYLPPAPFDTRYPGKDPHFSVAKQQLAIHQVIGAERGVTKNERDQWISQYDGGIAYLDSQLGELFHHLAQLGRYDGSLIVITSDHGEAFGERNVVGHSIFAYQNQVHVPLLVKYPGQSDPRIVTDVVSGVDLFATMLDVAGLAIPKNTQGESLASPAHSNRRYVFAETFPSERLPDPIGRFHRAERAIFEWPMKFIASTGGKRELYDLSDDPDEQHDLLAAQRAVAKALGEHLDGWVGTITPSGRPGIIDKATSDRLKSLGYIK